MRCLIIDDDDSPRTLMEKLIRASGHRATGVAGYDQALGALDEDGFDVAIVDLEMPGVSGIETIGRLRRRDPDLRVLVVSGYGDQRHVLDAIDAGADGYLLKDELGDALTASLVEVRAGHTPLSARVAGVVLRQLRSSQRGAPIARVGVRRGLADGPAEP